jgi:hypothetical protein
VHQTTRQLGREANVTIEPHSNAQPFGLKMFLGLPEDAAPNEVEQRFEAVFCPTVEGRVEHRGRGRRRYFVVTIKCPWGCRRRHVHSAGDDGYEAAGVRIPHCAKSKLPHPVSRYRIETAAETLPDPFAAMGERP